MPLLANPYSIKDATVYWRHHPVPQADAATFQHLGGDWGRDARRVFVQAKAKKVDIATFQFLNPVFAKDANAVYDWEGIIKGAIPASFEVLDPGIYISGDIAPQAWARGYARDAHSVYYHDQMTGRASGLRGADPASFISLRNDFGLDAKSVWFQKSKLPKADPKTWVYLGRLWSMDANRVFYAEREVPGVNREAFTVVAAPTAGYWATDCDRFFMTDQPIDEPKFWTEVSKEFASFEQWFRVAYHRIRKTCTTCEGSGDCYCKRKGQLDPACPRCTGTTKCHVCSGAGRTS